MIRRHFLQGLGVASAALLGFRATRAAPTALSPAAVEAIRRDWKLLLVNGNHAPNPSDAVTKSPQEWKQQLTAMQFNVLREEGTERPFSSPLDKEKREGVFACAGCDLPLFTSQMKFDSGTGWPSFITSIPGHLANKRDMKLFVPRTEYHCTRCGGHQGHIFEDGPAPTGERWCNNGVALKFIPSRLA